MWTGVAEALTYITIALLCPLVIYGGLISAVYEATRGESPSMLEHSRRRERCRDGGRRTLQQRSMSSRDKLPNLSWNQQAQQTEQSCCCCGAGMAVRGDRGMKEGRVEGGWGRRLKRRICDASVFELASSVDCIWGWFSPCLLFASLPSLRRLSSTLCLLVNYFPMWLIFVLMMEAVCHWTEHWKTLLCNRRNDNFLC